MTSYMWSNVTRKRRRQAEASATIFQENRRTSEIPGNLQLLVVTKLGQSEHCTRAPAGSAVDNWTKRLDRTKKDESPDTKKEALLTKDGADERNIALLRCIRVHFESIVD